MTPEQLDEIEKLAEAETADRWSAAEAGFNAAMRKYALPLVKALREAWAERDVAKECIRCDSKFSDYCSICWDSRDTELRAEVERLCAAITRFVNQYPWQQGPEIQELKSLVREEKT